MRSNIDPKIVLKHIDKLLKELERINKMPYNKGSQELKVLNREIKGLVRATFEDYENRIGKLEWAYAGAGKEDKRHFQLIKITKNYLLYLKQELNLINAFKDTQSNKNNDETSKSPVTQIFHGNIGNLALGDINTYNTNIYFDALIKAIEESENIPPENKKSLIDKIKTIAKDPYISGIGAGLIVEAIKTGLVGKWG